MIKPEYIKRLHKYIHVGHRCNLRLEHQFRTDQSWRPAPDLTADDTPFALKTDAFLRNGAVLVSSTTLRHKSFLHLLWHT